MYISSESRVEYFDFFKNIIMIISYFDCLIILVIPDMFFCIPFQRKTRKCTWYLLWLLECDLIIDSHV